MPRTQIDEYQVFKFSELSDKAKEKAREWFREGNLQDEWYDFVKEDFHGFLESIGFKNVDSQFSGFWSQGDGASFDYEGIDFNKLCTVRFDHSLAGTGEGLPGRIGLDACQPYSGIFETWRDPALLRKVNRFSDCLRPASSKTSYANHYCHSNTRYTSIESDFRGSRGGILPRMEKATNEFETALSELCKQLADAYYMQLDKEQEYLNSDEAVDESIEANEYEFLESGKRA